MLLGSYTSQATGYSYRVQYVASYDAGYINVLNTVDEHAKYVLPNGQQLYFTGGFISDYSAARSRLESLKKAGFKTAVIRLFHNGKLVSSYDLN